MNNLKNNFSLLIVLFAFGFMFSAWGIVGHNVITKGAALSFNNEMAQFLQWADTIAIHSADADRRRTWDKTEAVKHYIDIDNYSEYTATGSISFNYDTLVARYGDEFVNQQGTLPWATIKTFDSLVVCFRNNDIDNALIMMADLSHYVADGHMPLHISKNYDGEETGNKGIHSRYESKMLKKFVDDIKIEAYDTQYIDQVPDYIFSYLLANYAFVDSILLADNYAHAVNSDYKSDQYYEALWGKSKNFTNVLFQNASNALANLYYTAWLMADSPQLLPNKH